MPNGPNVPNLLCPRVFFTVSAMVSLRIEVLKSCLLETLVVTDGRQL